MLRYVCFPFFEIKEDTTAEPQTPVCAEIDIPDVCPMCHSNGVPLQLASVAIDNDIYGVSLVAILFCVRCQRPFLATYRPEGVKPIAVEPSALASRAFDKPLEQLSPRFVQTYNQTLAAETLGLSELTGMGYRKALEFLVKDYLIHSSPDDADTIRSEALGSCIANRIMLPQLKASARGAVWLGNDFTHYERRYAEFEIDHLKRFIDAVVYWVLMELTTEEAGSMDRR